MGGHTLKRNAEGVPDFLSGREFSRQEIQEIQETVRVCRRLSLKELVQTICEHLDWVTPAGRNKLASCAKALQQLEALGLVKLPRLCASKQRKGARAIVVGAGSAAEEEIAGTVREVGPVEVQPVGGKEAMQLWNEYVHRYHPLMRPKRGLVAPRMGKMHVLVPQLHRFLPAYRLHFHPAHPSHPFGNFPPPRAARPPHHG